MFLRRLIAAALLLVGLGAGMSAQSAHAQTPTTFTLEPGGKATISFDGFCTDFGKKFPTSIAAPNDVAPAAVQGGLAYIQSNNLGADEQKALDAQYGIWQLTGATGSPQGGDVAKAVVAAGKTPPTNPQGTSLLDAVKSNQVTLTLGTWSAVGAPVQIGAATDNFYGRGTLTVENTSNQRLTLYMPVGALFPPATAGDQTMAAYATKADVVNPQPTPQPTAQSSNTAGQQSPAQQLPRTGGADSPLPMLLVGALALLAIGAFVRVQRRAS